MSWTNGQALCCSLSVTVSETSKELFSGDDFPSSWMRQVYEEQHILNNLISNPIQDDQLLLLKGSFFELWVLRISALLLPINHQSNGVQNAMAMPSPQGNSLLWQQLMQVLGGELFQTMYSVAQEFNQLCMLETEVALYGGSLIAARGESHQSDLVWSETRKEAPQLKSSH